jgi:hypothetical protein
LFLVLQRNTQLQMSLKDGMESIGKAALAGVIAVGIAAAPANAYPNVNIRNETPYSVIGKVDYISCATQDYQVEKNRLWTAPSRGLFGWCLVTGITAEVHEAGGDVDATSYYSTGTGYAAFRVHEGGALGWIVDRP